MDNKETLQSHNDRLIQNNTDLSEVLDMINNMPEPEPNVQDKTVEITENGIITVTPDSDYDGLSSVTININAAEDLEEELTDYNTKLTTQRTSIQDIVLALEGKSAGNGIDGSKSKPITNIFMQEEEPETKEGIWLQTNNKFTHVRFAKEKEVETIASIDATNVGARVFAASAMVGDDIYVFGGKLESSSGDFQASAYKYNIIDKTRTFIANYPLEVGVHSAVAIGDYIYIFGGRNNSFIYLTDSYRYNITNNTYEKLTNLPTTRGYTGAVAVGTDIYIIGGEAGSTKYTDMLKYNTLDNTYETIELGINFQNQTSIVIGTNIYMIKVGSLTQNTFPYTIHKYDTLSKTLTSYSTFNFPYGICNAATDDLFIYYIGYSETDLNIVCFNTLTKETKIISNYGISHQCNFSQFYNKNGTLYILGGHNDGVVNKNIYSVPFRSVEEYENDVIVIKQFSDEDPYSINFTYDDTINISVSFYDAAYFNALYGFINNVPTYYGDGTQWVKIKN